MLMTQQIHTYTQAKRRYLGNPNKLANRALAAKTINQGRSKRSNANRAVVALCGAGGDILALRRLGYQDQNLHVAEFERKLYLGARRDYGKTVNLHYGCVSAMCRNLAAQGIRADVSLDLTSFLCNPSLELVKKVVQSGVLEAGKRLEVTFLAGRDHDFKTECLARYPFVPSRWPHYLGYNPQVGGQWPEYLEDKATSEHVRAARKRLLRVYLNRFGKSQDLGFRLLHDASDPDFNYFNQTTKGKPGGSSMSMAVFVAYAR